MAWVKIENNIVIQKQPYQENGFVEVADTVVCGMIQQGDSFVVPPKTLEQAIENLRSKRNRLLAETDYLALSDSTLSDDMKTYRQNLRDLPAGKDTVAKCEGATWPTKPQEDR